MGTDSQWDLDWLKGAASAGLKPIEMLMSGTYRVVAFYFEGRIKNEGIRFILFLLEFLSVCMCLTGLVDKQYDMIKISGGIFAFLFFLTGLPTTGHGSKWTNGI